jgi:hypothetical protein
VKAKKYGGGSSSGFGDHNNDNDNENGDDGLHKSMKSENCDVIIEDV